MLVCIDDCQVCPRGPMDKASAYEAGDCGFESRRRLFMLLHAIHIPSFFVQCFPSETLISKSCVCICPSFFYNTLYTGNDVYVIGVITSQVKCTQLIPQHQKPTRLVA